MNRIGLTVSSCEVCFCEDHPKELKKKNYKEKGQDIIDGAIFSKIDIRCDR